MRYVAAVSIAVLLAAGCRRNEPVSAGKPLSHWVSEARQVSMFSFWNSDKDERRRIAFQHLVEIGEPAVPSLLMLMEKEENPVSANAVNALGALGSKASSALPRLKELEKGGRPELRRSAAVLIDKIEGRDYRTNISR